MTARRIGPRDGRGGMWYVGMGVLLLLIVVGMAIWWAGRGEDETPASSGVVPLDTSPAALDQVPQNLEAQVVVISGGGIEGDRLDLAREQSVVLTLDNRDGETYVFAIAPGLVGTTPVKASGTTDRVHGAGHRGIHRRTPARGERRARRHDRDRGDRRGRDVALKRVARTNESPRHRGPGRPIVPAPVECARRPSRQAGHPGPFARPIPCRARLRPSALPGAGADVANSPPTTVFPRRLTSQ